MKRLMLLALCSFSSVVFAGKTYIWTGAQDSLWVNPANWIVDGAVAKVCPGVVSNEVNGVFSPAQPTSDTAVFDGTGAAQATVNLDGLYSIANVRVTGANAPKYTFGIGTVQTLPFETNGSFVVENSVPAANCPVINANIAFPVNVDSAWWSGSSIGIQLTYANDTEGTLTLNGTFGTKGIWFRPDAMSNVYRELTVTVRAENGALAFYGDQCENKPYLISYDYYTKRLDLMGGCQFVNGKVNRWRKNADVYVGEGATFGYLAANNAGHILHYAVALKVFGPGDFRFATNADGQSFDNHACIDFGNGRMIDVETGTSSFASVGYSSSQLAPKAIYVKDKNDCGAFLRLNAETPGDYAEGFYSSGYFALEIPSVQQLEKCGALWLCATNKFYNKNAWRDWGYNYAFLNTRWTGDVAETFSTTVTNYNYATPQVFTLENAGSAALTAGMEYFVGGEKTALILKGTSAPIIYGVKVQGGAAAVTLSGSVVFTNGVDLSGMSVAVMSNATLIVEKASGLDGLPEICVSHGANVIEFEDGDMVIGKLTRTSGTLDIRSESGKTLILPQFAGQEVPWLTYDGFAVEMQSDGRAIARSKYAHDVAIAARGDVVPDGAGNVVGITSAGVGAADRLAADSVYVKGIVQKVETSATIALDAEQTLTAALLNRSAMAGGLTLGNVDGQGVLASSADGLLCDNDSCVHDITVRAALSSPSAMVRVTGRGETVFRGGTKSAESVAEFRVSEGTAVFAGGTYDFARFIVATNSKDSASTAIISNATVALSVEQGSQAGGVGGIYGANAADRIDGLGGKNRLVIGKDGSLILNGTKSDIAASFSDRTFHVGLNGDGIMEIEDGGMFDGRLQVGGWGATESDTKCNYGVGMVCQRGGVVNVWGINGNQYKGASGMGGFTDATPGSYELSGGNFVANGCFAVGFYQPGGVFDQIGGHSEFRSRTGWASDGFLLLGATNRGEGRVRVKNSRMDVYGQIAMCQTFSGEARSDLIVDGETAEVDTHDTDRICMIKNIIYDKDAVQATISCINGGTLAMTYFDCGNANRRSEDHRAVVNLDNGTLRTTVSDKDLVVEAAPSAPVFKAFIVGPGGATINTDGKTGNRSSVPFASPETGVVEDIVGFSPFACAGVHPKVDVEGDGYGAVAFAEYDCIRQMVTNITVVAGGTGYTAAKLVVKRGAIKLCEFEAKIGEPASGSFTKDGAGDFTFAAANTYGGATILRGGVLKLGTVGALPSDTEIVYEGGALETAAEFCPPSLKVRIPNDGKVRKLNVITFSDVVPDTLPDVEILNGQSGRWVTRVSGRTLKILNAFGTKIFIR